MDAAARRITVRESEGTRTVEVMDTTRVWLDRSAAALTNLVGSFADCEVGRRVEVRYSDAGGTTAEWIKVEIPSSN